MKKVLCGLLLLSCCVVRTNAEEQGNASPSRSAEKKDEQVFFLDVSLCDDEDELLYHNMEIPEQSALREWMTKIGCIILAKYYVAQDFVQDRYDKTKKILARLKNYYFPTKQDTRKRTTRSAAR